MFCALELQDIYTMMYLNKWYLSIRICFVFSLIIPPPVVAEEHTDIQLLVFATQAKPPLSLFLKSVMQEALKPLAIEMEMLEMPGNRTISEVHNGRVDGDLGRIKNLKTISDMDVANYLVVNEPVIVSSLVLITRAGVTSPNIINWETVNQYSVAYVRGAKLVQSNLKTKQRVGVTTPKQALEMVASSRVDATVLMLPIANNLLSQHTNLTKSLKIHAPVLMPVQLFSYLHKKHAKLIPKLEKSLENLKHTDYFEKIALKYELIAIDGAQKPSISKIKETNPSHHMLYN